MPNAYDLLSFPFLSNTLLVFILTKDLEIISLHIPSQQDYAIAKGYLTFCLDN
jgi:hypothetical protein